MRMTTAIIGVFGLCFGALCFGDEPQLGKQLARSIELPASTSTWDFGRDNLHLIGEPRPLDESKTDTLRYWLFLPHDYTEQAASGGAPLFLFLHGAGERGDTEADLDKVKVHGPPKLLDGDSFAQKWPCVTVAPQCKNGFCWSPAQLRLLLDAIEKEFTIDKSRIYVSGISMGGFGTWMCLNESPTRFAAAAPICGSAKPEWGAGLTDVPIWAFHGNADFVVPLAGMQKIVDAIRDAGGERVIFSIYDGVGHDSWTATYNNQLFYDWMWNQHRNGKK
ncbi:MAG: prolyl oligopeptidase family serine peptidase [Thermoguttaceae bacterium]